MNDKIYNYKYTELEPDENGRLVEIVITCEGKETDRYQTNVPDGLYFGGSDYNSDGGRVYNL